MRAGTWEFAEPSRLPDTGGGLWVLVSGSSRLLYPCKGSVAGVRRSGCGSGRDRGRARADGTGG